MRGLDSRIALAYAKILTIIDPDAGMDSMSHVDHAAFTDGLYDYREGVTTPPLLFAGEPKLIAAWQSAQHFAAGLDEMAECNGCQNSDGNPCINHG